MKVLTLIFALLTIGLLISLLRANALQEQAVLSLEPLQESIAGRDRVLANYRERLHKLELTATVDQAALEELRSEMKRLQDVISDQAEEIRFYKGLMDPASLSKGIGFQGFSVKKALLPRHYEFSLTVHQVANDHQFRKGYVEISLSGERDGEKAVFTLKQLSDSINAERIPLGFKYFQTIDSEIELPEGFVPAKVEVVAYFPGFRAKKVREEFKWPELE